MFILLTRQSFTMDMPNPQGLDPSDRPEMLKQVIQADFMDLSSNLHHWNYNGAARYIFLNIDTAEFAKTIIKAAPSDQKDFYLLDIGSGKFNWGIGTAEYLNKQTDIPNDITIHIISVTGENYGPLKVYSVGKCKLYNISAFKIEDLKNSFEKIHLDFNGKFDLIVSQYTFVHLHDPVGTFVQAYNLLRPKTGFMLTDGFPVYFGPDEPTTGNFFNRRLNLLLTLIGTKAPYLIGQSTSDRPILSFLLKRPNEDLLSLPLKYSGNVEYAPSNNSRKSVPYFRILQRIPKFLPLDLNFSKNTFYGDKDLYEWVYTHYPFWQTFTTSWGPLFVDDPSPRIEH
jgi:SAM-dependent methyltransferase